MDAVNPNRYTVSSSFLLPKIFLSFLLIVNLGNFVSKIWEGGFTLKLLFTSGTVTSVLAIILYYIFKRKRIDYDDTLQILYIVDTKNETEEEVPVEKVEKILYSAVGFGRGSGSYVIVYKDFHNQKQKLRFILFLLKNILIQSKRMQG